MSTNRRTLFAFMATTLLLLAACGGPEPTATPTATEIPATITPTAVPLLLTPTEIAPLPAQFTVTPSPTISPTPTNIPPTRTPSPQPPSPTPFAAFTNTPQPSPTAVALVLDVTVSVEPQDIALVNDFLWVAHPDGEIQVLTSTGTLLTTVHTDNGAVALTGDGSRLWVAHRSGVITQIDGGSGAITARWTLPCAQCLVRGIHWDGSALWLSNFAENTLNRLDVSSGSINVFDAGGDSPTIITSDTHGLLVLHQSLAAQSTVLTRHDPATGEMLNSLTAAGFPTAVFSNGTALWLSLREAETGSLIRYDALSLAETWRVEATPANALLLAANRLWSADFVNDTVTARDPGSGAVLDVYPAGDLPQALLYDKGLLWVVNRRAGTLTRYFIGS